MGVIPNYKRNENKNPHPNVVILGAGASLAAFPNGDKFGKPLPLMQNMVELTGIENELKGLGFKKIPSDFEETFDNLYKYYRDREEFQVIKNKIFDYFRSMEIPDHLSLYDKLILSLREKDLIATFNWDPLLPLAFQRNRHLKKLPQLAFLHGNVFVGSCSECKTMGFVNCLCSKCGRRFKNVNLLYPIKDKTYTDDEFIKGEWELLKQYLDKAFIITIFGYSAPKTDMAARELLLDVWRQNKIRNFGEIEIIDVKPEEEIEENWYEFFIKDHYEIYKSFEESYIHMFPRRTGEAFASKALFNDPWESIEHFNGDSLTEYQSWVYPFIQNELTNEKDSTPLSRW